MWRTKVRLEGGGRDQGWAQTFKTVYLYPSRGELRLGLWGAPKVAGLREGTQNGKAREKKKIMIEKNIVGRM